MNANLLYVKKLMIEHIYSETIYFKNYDFHRKDYSVYEVTKDWFPPVKVFPNIKKS